MQNPVIKPAIVNQDHVENHFCQVCSCNGQNDNQTFYQKQSTNSIRLRQTTNSPKTNASRSRTNNDTRLSIGGYQWDQSLFPVNTVSFCLIILCITLSTTFHSEWILIPLFDREKITTVNFSKDVFLCVHRFQTCQSPW